MDQEQEAAFIQAFIQRERRARTEFELSSPKKRAAFLSRLCHTYENVLDTRYLQALDPNPSDSRTILSILRRLHAPESCYVISMKDEFDGQFVPLVEALDSLVGYGFPSILICIPNTLAYFEAEQSFGPPPRYLLRRA